MDVPLRRHSYLRLPRTRTAEVPHQSAEFQLIGFDELTQFTETQYTYLLSRLRRPAYTQIPLRMRSADNRGGVGHAWAKRRFVDPGDPARPFIPALLEDNPHLDREAYKEALPQLDPVTRAQLRHGDWTIQTEGRTFRREWFEIVKVAPVEVHKVRWWDLAATEPEPRADPDWTAGVLMGKTREGMYYVLDVVRDRTTPKGTEKLIRQTAQLDDYDTEIVMEQEPGALGKTVIDHYRTVLADYDFRGRPSSGSKEIRANPLTAQAEGGNVKLVEGPWNPDFLEELVLCSPTAHTMIRWTPALAPTLSCPGPGNGGERSDARPVLHLVLGFPR